MRMQIGTWKRPTTPSGGVALAALLSGAFVITAGFGSPVGSPSTSTASAETCALTGVTPSTVVVGLSDVHPDFGVTFTGCDATWSLSWPAAGATATQASPRGTIDAAKLAAGDAGRSNAYVTLRVDDGTSSRTPVPLVLKRRSTWGAFSAGPEPGRVGGTLTLTSRLGRADWEAGAYRGYAGRPVRVLFRAAGASTYSVAKGATTGTGGSVRVKVPARSGTYRLEFAGNSVTGPAVSGGDAVAVLPVPRRYKNCTALNKVYPHGVGRAGAKDRVSGGTAPVTTFARDTATYKLNTKSDRDGDNIACEKL